MIVNEKVVVPLKYLSSFWRSLDLPLISFQIELDLSCSRNCVISEISRIPAVPANPNANPHAPAMAEMQAISTTFQINNAKFYIPFVTLSVNNN